MNRFEPGIEVEWNDTQCVIVELKGLSNAIVYTPSEDSYDLALLNEMTLANQNGPENSTSFRTATEKQWALAMARFKIIEPLLNKPSRSSSDVAEVARAHNKGVATIYRWVRQFEKTGVTSSLIRDKRTDAGQGRLNPEVEAIMANQIDTNYLRKERPSVASVYDSLSAECYFAGIKTPSLATLHNRIKMLDRKHATTQRYSSKKSRQDLQPVPGKFPHNEIPMSVIQVDHTPLDIIIVDSEHRLPLGKPYLTFGVDIASRMIAGFFADLYAPSALTAGLCISHCMSEKSGWLALRGLDYEWPLHGKVQKIHVDNAAEFRGTMIKRACDNHGIVLENRPKGLPQFGGAVERAFKTFLQRIHEIPGTTFSSVAKKFDYDSEGNACMTLDELKEWLAVFMLGIYHEKGHAGISEQPPVQKYRQLVLGDANRPGVGAPVPLKDESTMRTDFLPYIERTIQRDGVVWDHVEYYSPVLNRWIGSKDPESPKAARKFVFTRDPSSLCKIYFWDPEIEQYFEIPYKDNSRTDTNIWELKQAKELLKQSKFSQINEENIFRAIAELRAIEDSAIEKTRLKKQSRASEKRKLRSKELRLSRPKPSERVRNETADEIDNGGFGDASDIKPFDIEADF